MAISKQTSQDWMKDPRLKNMSSKKLELLSSLARDGASKSKNEMLPFFMSVLSTSKDMNFSDTERDVLIDVLIQSLSSTEDKKKAETILRMTSAFRK